MIEMEKAAEDIFSEMDESIIIETIEGKAFKMGTKDVVVDPHRPSMASPEWHDFAMGHFEDDELFEGRPTANGLRRVAELLLGRIIFNGVQQVFPPMDGNSIGRSTVVWKVIFEDGSTFSDVADSWEGNTDDTFCIFATATAATRAEGRSLRKALRIKTVAAEEMTKKNPAAVIKSVQPNVQQTDGEYVEKNRMTDKQAKFIDIKCKQLNVNAAKLFKDIFNLSVTKKINTKQASDAIEKLNDYQNNIDNIPDTILGYSDEWRN